MENAENAWVLIETLVSTIARAFYTDTYIVVLDALLREKYIIEEELGPRLKLSAKEVRKITTQLEHEMLIKTENVYIDNNRSFIKCYYIDFNLFYHVVLYRISLMQKSVYTEEKTELTVEYYECPTCKAKSSSLQAMRIISKDGKFVCSHCCPTDNIRNMSSEPYFTLVSVDNSSKLNAVQVLEKKMTAQLNRAAHEHEGIYQLLARLKACGPLDHNLPSENIAKGNRSSVVMDSDVAEEIQNNMQFATGQFGSSLIRKAANTATSSSSSGRGGAVGADMYRTQFDIQIESEDADQAAADRAQRAAASSNSGRQLHNAYANRTAELPVFLQDSRVIGAASIMKAAEALQLERSSDGAVEQESKRARLTQDVGEPVAVAAGAAEGGEDDDDDDDVAWESDEEEG